MESKKTLSLIAIMITSTVWGLSLLSVKVIVDVIPPMTMTFFRFLIGSLVLSIIYMIKEKEKKLDKKDIPMFILSGASGVSAFIYFQNSAVQFISASSASIIVAAIPIFVLIAEVIVFKTKLSNKKIISVILSFIGVYFIVGYDSSLASSDSFKGYLMMFGAVIAWVVYSIATKPLYKKYSQISIVYFQTLFGTSVLIPSIFVETAKWSLVNNVIILNLLFLGIFCSAIAYYLYVYAMEHLGISTTALFLNLIPVITVVSSYFILKEKIGIYHIIGGALVVTSVYLANIKGKSGEEKLVEEGELKKAT
ncbi:DMT family transporter [Maledivibacter halophilus]|uniref:Permease of the drug/metabolite transporter (DMT) superfamily n=1 Tax=Maledivibacter halophilus TaxID=36842 RepID=A0A1T5LZC2_9FIRM|nr:DMT family transporter [Maledivibacter halophilus]SKC81321.1 Permease of the drug/metabolite transporter (DMT) superfamily [Maledivibacter halophilus]